MNASSERFSNPYQGVLRPQLHQPKTALHKAVDLLPPMATVELKLILGGKVEVHFGFNQ